MDPGFSSPHTAECGATMAKTLRDILSKRYALTVPLPACQDAIARGAGRNNWNDFRKNVAKAREVPAWQRERVLESLVRHRVSPAIGDAALAELEGLLWTRNGRTDLDLSLLSGPFAEATALDVWQQRLATLATRTGFRNLVAEMVRHTTDPAQRAAVIEDAREMLDNLDPALRARIVAAIDTLGARPQHAAWPALTLAALSEMTYGAEHKPEDEDHFVWHRFEHAFEDLDPVSLSGILEDANGVMSEYVADLLVPDLPWCLLRLVETEPGFDLAAIGDVAEPFARVTKRFEEMSEAEKAVGKAAERALATPFWLSGTGIARSLGLKDGPVGAWTWVEAAPAETLEQARAQQDADAPPLAWVKVVILGYGPLPETAALAAYVTVTKHVRVSADYDMAYSASTATIQGPWSASRFTEGALAIAVTRLLHADSAAVHEAAVQAGGHGKVRMLLDFPAFAPDIQDVIHHRMGSKPMPEDFRERLEGGGSVGLH